MIRTTDSVIQSRPEPVEIVVWTGAPGAPGADGADGAPGAGVRILGIAAAWPPAPAGEAEQGDLYVLPNPLPPGTPAGFAPGDGAAWDGSSWVNTGPIRGETGPATVVVSDTPPPPPTVDGFLWIEPDAPEMVALSGSSATVFDEAAPIEYLSQPITEQTNGLPIGLSADGTEIHQPYMVGAVPIIVGGKRYLIPIIEG